MKTPSLVPPLPAAPLGGGFSGAGPRELVVPGEIVPAALVAELDAQRVLIQIKGRHLIAETPGPLPDQGEFQVRVEQVEPRMVLRLVAGDTPAGSAPEARLKACLAGDRPAAAAAEAWQALNAIAKSGWPPEIREVWTEFQGTLQKRSGRLAAQPAAEAFEDLLNLSGLNWENKLQTLARQGDAEQGPNPAREDLKGLLLFLKSRLEPADPELVRTLEPLLQKIELCQWLNVSESGEFHLLLFFPWWLPEGPAWAELLISEEPFPVAPPGGKRASLLFLLHLPGLGKLRVEVVLGAGSLYGRFKTERPEVAAFLRDQLPGLKKGLAALGYQAVLESLAVEAEQLGDSLPARLAHWPASLVSRVV